MKIVRRLSDSVAIYLLADNELASIDANGLHGAVRALDIRPETHDVVTDVPAPAFWHGGVLAWDGDDWSIADQTAYDAAVAAALAARKAKMKAAITARRWEVETGGITVSGAAIATDAGTQAKLSGALQLVQADDQVVIDWKGENGWVQLNAAAVTAVAVAVGRHVQAAFTREKALHTAVDDAADGDDLDLIYIAAGSVTGSGSWPN